MGGSGVRREGDGLQAPVLDGSCVDQEEMRQKDSAHRERQQNIYSIYILYIYNEYTSPLYHSFH